MSGKTVTIVFHSSEVLPMPNPETTVRGVFRCTLSPDFGNAWDTGNLRSMVKNSRAIASYAHISVIGHITADDVKR
jgi:hypothetical protein